MIAGPSVTCGRRRAWTRNLAPAVAEHGEHAFGDGLAGERGAGGAEGHRQALGARGLEHGADFILGVDDDDERRGQPVGAGVARIGKGHRPGRSSSCPGRSRRPAGPRRRRRPPPDPARWAPACSLAHSLRADGPIMLHAFGRTGEGAISRKRPASGPAPQASGQPVWSNTSSSKASHPASCSLARAASGMWRGGPGGDVFVTG